MKIATLTAGSRRVRCSQARQRDLAQRRTRIATAIAAVPALAAIASVSALTLAAAIAGSAAIAAVAGVSALTLTAAIAGIAAIAALVAVAGIAPLPALVEVHASLPQHLRSNTFCGGVQEMRMQVAAQARRSTCSCANPLKQVWTATTKEPHRR